VAVNFPEFGQFGIGVEAELFACIQAFGQGVHIVVHIDMLFGTDGIDEIINVVNVGILPNGGVVLGEGGFELFFIEAVQDVEDAFLFRILGRFLAEAWEHDKAEVGQVAKSNIDVVARFVAVGADADHHLFGNSRAEADIKLVGGGHSATAYIGRVARDGALVIAHELIIMRIMNGTGDESPGFPTERYFALGTPHLVTPANLEDAFPTGRTRLGIFLEEGGGFHVVLVAHVVFAFDLAALRADVCGAYLAFPRGR